MAYHKYFAYGLGIHSEIPLWGAERPHTRADLTVTVRDEPACGAQSAPRPDNPQDLFLAWPGIAGMQIREGREIVLSPNDEAEVSHLRHLVSGLGIGLALHQRGVFALHASAAAMGGGAIAIAGAKGAGKSTLVAALARRGHQLLTDDVVALDFQPDGQLHVRVGPPNINLWPDSAAVAGDILSDVGTICSLSSKLGGWMPGLAAQLPAPLSAVLVLMRGTGDCTRLGLLDAFPELVGHTHAFRWVEDNACNVRHFEQCRRLLAHVPVYRVARGTSLEHLDALVTRVEALVEEIQKSQQSTDPRVELTTGHGINGSRPDVACGPSGGSAHRVGRSHRPS